jgi:hypothetical protein
MKSKPFLITGLPRSRTAWMAAAALNDVSICVHEPLRSAERWEDVFTTVWNMSGFRYLGVSDHGMGFHLPEIMNRLAPQTLIIQRPIREVEASLRRLRLPDSNICELLQGVLDSVHHHAIMRVAYDDLCNTATVARCLRHLMPDASISWDRIRNLQRLNIQAHDIGAVITDGITRGRKRDVCKLIPPHLVEQFRLLA